MLDGTLIVIVSDHGGWRKTHNAAGGGFQPFAALVDIPILIRGESTVIYLALPDPLSLYVHSKLNHFRLCALKRLSFISHSTIM